MLVEDHVVIRQGLASLLARHENFLVVGEAGDMATARAIYEQAAPDVTLVDLRLGEERGVDLIRDLRARFTGGRFLVLTTYDGADDISRALEAGARGYLLKGMSRSVLVEAIETVHAGGRYVPRELAERLLPGPGEPTLTEREQDVLRHIAEGLDNREIGRALGIAESTVKTHVASLYAKLEVDDRTKALITAVRRGLVRLG